MFIFYVLAFLLGVDGLDRLDKSFSRGLIEIGVGFGVAIVALLVQLLFAKHGVDLED